MKPEDLVELAERLRLTQKQRRFAEALVLDPERNQSRAAVASGSTEKQAPVDGSRLIRLDKVKRYMAAFVEVTPQSVRKATRPRIADRNEVLRRLTRQARADVGRHLVLSESSPPVVRIDPKHTAILRGVKVRSGPLHPDTGVATWTETEIKVADPVVPLQALARIYGMEEERRPEVIRDIRALIVQVLVKDPDAARQFDELARRTLPEIAG